MITAIEVGPVLHHKEDRAADRQQMIPVSRASAGCYPSEKEYFGLKTHRLASEKGKNGILKV